MGQQPEAGERRLDLSLVADVHNIALATRAVAGVCIIAGLTAEQVDEVELGLAEALNNVVEHAYIGRAGGPIRVAVRLFPQVLLLDIEDEGIPLDPARLTGSLPVLESCALEDLPEGGMGLGLISNLFDTVSYASQHGTNRMSLTRRLVVT